jgi:two-component system chemotaxis response regulator CheY
MLHFLVVDDSRVLRKVVHSMLDRYQFYVVEAADGQEALERCQALMPDGILLDWNMPVMDGLSFLKALRQMPGGDTPKVIFCTTEGDMSRITEALAAGADEYIMKPFDDDVLASKLEIVGFINQTADAA